MKLLKASIIGTIIGIIDIIPMIIQGNNLYEIISAFVFWIILANILIYISMPVKNWQKGVIVAILLYVPVVILVASYDQSAILPMFASSIILGGITGFLTGKFAKEKHLP